MRKALALIAILAFAGGARAETLVQLDYGWRSDGKASCTPGFLAAQPWRRAACLDPVADLENYAERLDAQFLGNPLCHGIKFIRFPWAGPGNTLTLEQASAILKRPHWYFWLYAYNTGDDVQSWYLRTPQNQIFNGHGTTHEIARQACSLIAHRGDEMLR